MKLGITETSIGKYGADRFKKMAELGFGYADFQLAQTKDAWYTADEDTLLRMIAETNNALSDAGVIVHQAHGPWDQSTLQQSTPEERAARMNEMRRSIRITAMLGCKNWVIHPNMPFGTHDLDNGRAEETWEYNLSFMRELLPFAKEQGVTICLENMPMVRFSISKPAEILKFVREMGDDNFKICLDTGHVNVFEGLNLGDAVRLFGNELRAMHVHDNDGRRDSHQFPYFGTAGWEDFGAALREIGYDGVFSFETGPSWDMPQPLFDDACRLLVTTAHHILGA